MINDCLLRPFQQNAGEVWTGSSPWRRSCASGPARGVAERGRAVAVTGSRTGGPARAITERPGAV
jgi:hypothetical protein